MASIANDPNGRKRIQFVAPDGSRKTLRLGKCDRKGAESILRHVEALLGAKIGGQPMPRDTAVWLSEIGTELLKKLAGVGLAKLPERAKIEDFLDRFISIRISTLKHSTILNLEQAKNKLIEYFGKDREISTITQFDAEAFASNLHAKYAPATAGRTIRRAKQFFSAALRNKLVDENVFSVVKSSSRINKDRQFHVDREIIHRVIEAAPDPEWRLLIALSRFGGLRCPSEHLELRWE